MNPTGQSSLASPVMSGRSLLSLILIPVNPPNYQTATLQPPAWKLRGTSAHVLSLLPQRKWKITTHLSGWDLFLARTGSRSKCWEPSSCYQRGPGGSDRAADGQGKDKVPEYSKVAAEMQREKWRWGSRSSGCTVPADYELLCPLHRLSGTKSSSKVRALETRHLLDSTVPVC